MTDIAPQRIRLSRAKGFNLHAASLACNGCPALSVARPGKWGNPYRIGDTVDKPGFDDDSQKVEVTDQAVAVALFREWMDPALKQRGAAVLHVALDELRGNNLACWCELGTPCHADILLALANRELARGLVAPPSTEDCDGREGLDTPAACR